MSKVDPRAPFLTDDQGFPLTGVELLIYWLITEHPELKPLELARLTGMAPFAVVRMIGRIGEEFPNIPNIDDIWSYGEAIAAAEEMEAE